MLEKGDTERFTHRRIGRSGGVEDAGQTSSRDPACRRAGLPAPTWSEPDALHRVRISFADPGPEP